MGILCFGEPLIRLSTVAHERLDDARNLEISYSGAEVVVATTLAQLGQNVAFVSVVPENRLGTNAIMNLARYGIDTARILRSNHRMGLYYSERGRSIRPTVVTYDRSDTSMANAQREDFDWDHILNGVEVFFFSGVVPAISDEMYHVCIEALRACKGRGIKTIMDLNYRETMWSREEALSKIGKLMPLVDELVASEDDIISIEHASVEEPDLFDFCLNWARVWASKASPQVLDYLVKSDPHSPNEARVNAALSHIDAWSKAFNGKKGDKLFLPKNKRAHIW